MYCWHLMTHKSQIMKSPFYIFLAQNEPQDQVTREASRRASSRCHGSYAGNFEERSLSCPVTSILHVIQILERPLILESKEWISGRRFADEERGSKKWWLWPEVMQLRVTDGEKSMGSPADSVGTNPCWPLSLTASTASCLWLYVSCR